MRVCVEPRLELLPCKVLFASSFVTLSSARVAHVLGFVTAVDAVDAVLQFIARRGLRGVPRERLARKMEAFGLSSLPFDYGGS